MMRDDLRCDPEILKVRAGILASTPADHMFRIGVVGETETHARELFQEALERWSRVADEIDAAKLAKGDTR